jgi:Fic family protein
MLGECQSKCAHLAGIPLLPDKQDEFHRIYLAKGVQGTTAIEGNTLSEQQVKARIEGKLKLPPSKKYLEQEIDNIIEACNQIGTEVYRDRALHLTVDRIKEFNKLVLRGLELESGVIPGEVCSHMVGVGRYRGCPREDCEYLMKRLTDWLVPENFPYHEPLNRVGMAVIRAILAHIYLAWIHPFGDGNGRTARLVEFQILCASGVPAPAAHLLSNFYNETRVEYYRQLDYASKSGGDVFKFLSYAIQGFRDGLREQIVRVRGQQLEVMWHNYIYTQMGKEGDTASVHRQRDLALDLSKTDEALPLAKLRNLTPRLAMAYYERTDKTLKRDVNTLLRVGLITREGRLYRANRRSILAWLPDCIELEDNSSEYLAEVATSPHQKKGDASKERG